MNSNVSAKQTTTTEKTMTASARFAPVDSNCAYPLELFRQITGLDSWALRMARRNGLRVVTVGRRKFVKGSDFIAYLDNLSSSENVSNG